MSSNRELPSAEYLDARRAIDGLPATVERVEEILARISELPSIRDRFRDEYLVLGPDGPITWANHEQLTWSLGESIRQILRAQPTFRKDAGLWEAIERVASDHAAGKGRQPFVMLLGQYGGRARAPLLMHLLDDPEMVGHALYALRRLGVPDAKEKARALLSHNRAWIRREAKKYLKKVDAAA